MVIKFEIVHVIEYYENALEVGRSFDEIKERRFLIKLTKRPTEEDKK